MHLGPTPVARVLSSLASTSIGLSPRSARGSPARVPRGPERRTTPGHAQRFALANNLIRSPPPGARPCPVFQVGPRAQLANWCHNISKSRVARAASRTSTSVCLRTSPSPAEAPVRRCPNRPGPAQWSVGPPPVSCQLAVLAGWRGSIGSDCRLILGDCRFCGSESESHPPRS